MLNNDKKYQNINHEMCNSDEIFNKRIWRVGDVAKFLKCSVGHVYNLASEERIPKIKKGKSLYFVPEKILNWILEGDTR